MKKCPSCNQLFSDDNVFCMNDGTTLLLVSETGSNPPVFPTADNATTQVVSRPQISSQIPVQSAPNDSSKWLFLIIGILVTAVAGMGIYMFAGREKNENKETVSQSTKSENKSETTNPVETSVVKDTETIVPKTNPTAEQPKINPNLNPAGSWSGDLSYPSGANYSAQMSLTDEGGGRFRGQIVWTLVRTANANKSDKIGLSATEFVQGNFDAATRTLSLNGYSKSDASNLGIILDKYRLTLGENNRQMNGYSFGGKKRGNFRLGK